MQQLADNHMPIFPAAEYDRIFGAPDQEYNRQKFPCYTCAEENPQCCLDHIGLLISGGACPDYTPEPPEEKEDDHVK